MVARKDVLKAKKVVREYYEEHSELYRGVEHPTTRCVLRLSDEALLGVVGGGDVVLDLGCGTGRFTRLLQLRCKMVFGVDFSSSMLSHAKKVVNVGTCLVLADGEKLPFKDGVFDVVVSAWGSMSNLPDLARGVMEIGRVLKPGGKVGLTFFNRLDLIKIVGTILCPKRLGKLLDYHRGIALENGRFFAHLTTPRQITTLMRQNRMTPKKLMSVITIHTLLPISICKWLGKCCEKLVKLVDKTPFNQLGYMLIVLGEKQPQHKNHREKTG